MEAAPLTVGPGDAAPDFTLDDQRGQPWTLSAHRGRPVVLYFYPRADTPGCTTQACDVRDHWQEFSALQVPVAGISPDDVAALQRFTDDNRLPHTLLADPERAAIDAYGAWGPKTRFGETREGVIRSSVVVDADGRIAEAFAAIKPSEQSTRALEVVRELLG